MVTIVDRCQYASGFEKQTAVQNLRVYKTISLPPDSMDKDCNLTLQNMGSVGLMFLLLSILFVIICDRGVITFIQITLII